jgi:hypothetical protein
MTSFEPEARVHDFGPGRCCWGHHYSVTDVRNGGQEISASGWGNDGSKIWEGDYLLLQSPDGRRTSRYRVTEIEHLTDPPDMWNATLTFAPRSYATAAEKEASR